MWRADLFFSLGDQNQVDWQLASGCADSMKRRNERCFWPFLVDGSAADEDSSEVRFFDQLRIPGRRTPLRRVNLLHVVHEIKTERLGCAGVQDRKDSRLAVSGNFRDFTKSGFAEETHGEIAAFADATILRCDGGLV